MCIVAGPLRDGTPCVTVNQGSNQGFNQGKGAMSYDNPQPIQCDGPHQACYSLEFPTKVSTKVPTKGISGSASNSGGGVAQDPLDVGEFIESARRAQQVEAAWRQHHQDRYGKPFINPYPDLTVALRDRLAEAQGNRCCWKGCRMDGRGTAPNAPSFEHIIPRSRGGTNHIDNIAIACVACNSARADREEGRGRKWMR